MMGAKTSAMGLYWELNGAGTTISLAPMSRTDLVLSRFLRSILNTR